MGCGGSKTAPAQAVTDRIIEIKITKASDNDRIGLGGVACKDCLEVSSVEGLVKVWNEQHTDSIVEVGDRIVACNGVQGDGKGISDAMNEGTDWQIRIAKAKGAPPEKSAPHENQEVADAPADDVVEPISAPLDTVPETCVQDAPESGVQDAKAKDAPPEKSAPHENHEVTRAPADDVVEPTSAPLDTVAETCVQGAPKSGAQEPVEESTTNVHGETGLGDTAVPNEPDQAPKQAAIATIEDDNEVVEHQGWRCDNIRMCK